MAYSVNTGSGLNAALAGINDNLGKGIGLGLEINRSRREDQRAALEQQRLGQVIQQANEQHQRETAARQAGGEAIDALAPQGPEMPQTAAGQPAQGPPAISGGVPHAQIIDHTYAVAKKIAANADNPTQGLKDATAYLEFAKQTHQQLVDKQERDSLTHEIGNSLADGTTWATQADGERVQSPQTIESHKQLLEMLASEKVPPGALRAQWNDFRASIAADRSRVTHRTRVLADMDQAIAGAGQQQGAMQQGPMPDGGGMGTTSQQVKDLSSLRHYYEIFQNEIDSDPKLREAFFQRFEDASQGMTTVGNQRVPYAQADSMRSMQAQLQASEARAKNAEAQLKETQAAGAPEAAKSAADLKAAQAEKARAQAEQARSAPASKPHGEPSAFEVGREKRIAEMQVQREAFQRASAENNVKPENVAKHADAIRANLGGARGGDPAQVPALIKAGKLKSEDDVRKYLTTGAAGG